MVTQQLLQADLLHTETRRCQVMTGFVLILLQHKALLPNQRSKNITMLLAIGKSFVLCRFSSMEH